MGALHPDSEQTSGEASRPRRVPPSHLPQAVRVSRNPGTPRRRGFLPGSRKHGVVGRFQDARGEFRQTRLPGVAKRLRPAPARTGRGFRGAHPPWRGRARRRPERAGSGADRIRTGTGSKSLRGGPLRSRLLGPGGRRGPQGASEKGTLQHACDRRGLEAGSRPAGTGCRPHSGRDLSRWLGLVCSHCV